jgi:hypothetical protein
MTSQLMHTAQMQTQCALSMPQWALLPPCHTGLVSGTEITASVCQLCQSSDPDSKAVVSTSPTEGTMYWALVAHTCNPSYLGG